MFSDVLKQAISSGLNYVATNSRNATGGSRFDPLQNAMSQQSAHTLVQPLTPKKSRNPSTPAPTVGSHPLRSYMDAFRQE